MFLALAGGEAQAQSAVTLSLADAVHLSLRQNWSVQESRAARPAEIIDLTAAHRTFVPQLSIVGNLDETHAQGGSGQDENIGPTINWTLPTGAVVNYSWTVDRFRNPGLSGQDTNSTLTVTQPLLRGAGYGIASAPIKLADLQDRIAMAQRRQVLASTITQVIAAYRSVQLDDELSDLAKARLGASQQLLGINQTLIDAGRLPASDLVQSQADVAAQELAVEEARDTDDLARSALLGLINIDPDTNLQIPEPQTDIPPPPTNATPVAQIALTHNLDYLKAELQVAQATIALAQADDGTRPSLALVGSLTNGVSAQNVATSPYTSSSSSEYVGLQLTMPVGDIAARAVDVHAKVNLEEDELAVRQTDSDVTQQVGDAVHTAQLLFRQVMISNHLVELSQRQYDNELLKLKAGLSSNFEVVSFQNSLEDAQVSAREAYFNYLNQLSALDELNGTVLDTWQVVVGE